MGIEGARGEETRGKEESAGDNEAETAREGEIGGGEGEEETEEETAAWEIGDQKKE